MPRATTSGTDTERYELKSLPEGYVVLRRLTYGEFLHRRDMISSLKVIPGRTQKDVTGLLDMASQKITEFEFANCIVEHNLEDDNGELLNFKNPMSLRMLDPRIGEEIGRYIDRMNQAPEEDDEALGNASRPLLSSGDGMKS